MLLRVAAAMMCAAVTGVAWAGPAPADVAALRAACDAPGEASVLVPAASPSAAPEARGVWMDASSLVWTGRAPATGARFVLAWSAHEALVARPGRPLSGADARVTLAAAGVGAEGLPAAWRWTGGGTWLQVLPGDRARVAASWRAQAMVVEEGADGRVVAATGVQPAGALDDAYAAAGALDDLGVRIDDGRNGHGARTRFALWAPTARRVALCRYPDGRGPALDARPLARDDRTGAWRAAISGDHTGETYEYLVDVDVPGLGLVRNRVTDPYAVSLTTDSRRSWVGRLDAPAVEPAGWAADRAPDTVKRSTDMVIYELHVRDFSASDATVPPAHRGKYLAFTDTDSAGMRHLRALARAGLTDVHLLPVFDFSTVPEHGCVTPDTEGPPDGTAQQAAVVADASRDCFNWGYDPFHYNAPEGSYATDPEDGAVRIREFREMVQALHGAGLRVGMDVVFNHTSAAGQAPASVLDRIVPGYYQRLDAAGAVEHSTCCANTATEHRMMGKLLVDSVVQWAVQYHVDSFRFDLMAHQPRAVMERLQSALAQATGRFVPLIGEGWNFGEVANGARFVQASQLSLGGSGIGTFSDRARDALRGGSPGDAGDPRDRQGWLNGLWYAPDGHDPGATREQLLAAADMVRVGLAGTLRDYPLRTWQGRVEPLAAIDYNGQPAGYATQPSEVVNYVENHDNATLWDNDVFKLPLATTPAERARVQVLGAAVVAFSQGVAYYHAGIDLLRSKSLDHNSFDSGDAFNRLDWSGRDNGFGHGLPPKPDNGALWPVMKPLLADAALKPSPADIAWTEAAFRDLLRIRASSALFHLDSAAEVRRRLSFPASGPGQDPTVLVGRLDGRGLPGANFGAVMYFLNADVHAKTIDLPAERGQAWRLHPVFLAPGAADLRAAHESAYDPATGRFTIPARTAVVFVAP